MAGEKDLNSLLKDLHPKLNPGTYVFITTKAPLDVDRSHIIFEFKEFEGVTHIISKEKAEELELEYAFVSSWITLNVHSSLEAIGLTAAIAGALTKIILAVTLLRPSIMIIFLFRKTKHVWRWMFWKKLPNIYNHYTGWFLRTD
ncbi:hypothetical protein SAMN04488009_2814 [Maribacter sedimenticola]|uniref:DUF2241 domain-containing protein n=1 Tax=Maribacter sedimenticola TaxID=228956 RepID=A0ABY1SJ46_9FLAO|nr:ACT domain-containing protein [Maribacter sedimenticola]SNR61111.1 hypothetical protein SAMN04488009_2814 [Maribacter sedimenticola]